MDLADEVRFDDQRHPQSRLGAGLGQAIEPLEGPVERGGSKHGLGTLRADPKHFALAAIAAAQDMAELGQHAILQPAQQCGTFAIDQTIGISCHRRLHLRPIAHGGANIAQRGAQGAFQLAPGEGIAALGFEINHRFAPLTRRIPVKNCGQSALTVAAHRDNWMDQPIDRQALGGDRR